MTKRTINDLENWLNSSVSYTDYISNSIENSVSYTDYISNSIENSVSYTDYISNSIEQHRSYIDYKSDYELHLLEQALSYRTDNIFDPTFDYEIHRCLNYILREIKEKEYYAYGAKTKVIFSSGSILIYFLNKYLTEYLIEFKNNNEIAFLKINNRFFYYLLYCKISKTCDILEGIHTELCMEVINTHINNCENIKDYETNAYIDLIKEYPFLMNIKDIYANKAIVKKIVNNTTIDYNNTLPDYTETDLCNFLKKDPKILRLIENQTESLCNLACSLDGLCLKYVKNQTANICYIAIKQNKEAKQYSRFNIREDIFNFSDTKYISSYETAYDIYVNKPLWKKIINKMF